MKGNSQTHDSGTHGVVTNNKFLCIWLLYLSSFPRSNIGFLLAL